MRRLQSILFLILFILAGWWLLSRMQLIPSLPQLLQPKPVTIDKTSVWIKEIKALAQLVTISAYDELVADSTRTLLPERFRIPSIFPPIVLPRSVLLERKLVLIGKTTTHVGINMARLQQKDVTAKGDSLHLNLPKAQVLDVLLNPSDVDVFIEEGQWENAAMVQLKNKIRRLAAAKVYQKGLLAQSEQKARTLFTDFFTAAGFNKVTIQFQ